MSLTKYSLLILAVCSQLLLHAQEQNQAQKPSWSTEMSIFEYFRGDKAPKKKPTAGAPKTFYLIGIPVISSNPVVGTAFGGVLNGAFVIGGDYTTDH